MSSSILEVYDKKSDYYSLATDISDVHKQMTKAYDDMHGKINELNAQSVHWTLEYEKAKVRQGLD